MQFRPRQLGQVRMAYTRALFRILRASAQTATILGLLTLALTWVGIASYLTEQREQAGRAAVQNAENLARAFEEQIVETVRSIDQALLFIRTQIQKDPDHFDLDTWGKNAYYTSDVAIQLAYIGPDGFMVSSNVASQATPRVDLGDREHFRVHADSSKDELFISKPVLGRVTNKWTIQLTRRIFKADGSFGGVLVASLDPSYLSRFYESIDIGQNGVINLFGRDGIIRAHGGKGADLLGKEMKSRQALQALGKASAGTYQGSGGLDGLDRIFAYRVVRGLPLVVNVGLDRGEVFASYFESRTLMTRAGWILTVVTLLAMLWSVYQRVRLDSTRRLLLSKTQALGLTLSSMSEGILMVNADQQVVVINEQGRRQLGVPDSSACPFPVSDLELLSSSGAFSTVREDGSDQDVHIREIEKDGHTLEIHRVDLPTGGFVKTITDVTRKKAIQRDIEDARDRAEAASRARAAFLATMSHEIRTPLSGVISMADLLGQTQLDRDQRWYTHVARESAEHLLQLLDDILDISKFEAGRLTLESISFELPHAIQNVIEMLAPKARGKGLSFGCHIEPTLPKRIIGDPGRLRQILINLIGNAVKFTSHGHVSIRVLQAQSATGTPSIRFEIEDTGIGISQTGIASLFQDFSQLDDSISRRFGGSGLGLSICKKLVTKMGGTIEVTSEVGKGATFAFTLPLLRDENSGEPAIRSLEGCSVLVLADNEFERNCLVHQLQSCGAKSQGFGDLASAGNWLDTDAHQDDRLPVLVSVGTLPGVQNWRAPEPGARSDLRRLLIATGELAINRDDAACSGFDDVLVAPVSAVSLVESVYRYSQRVLAADLAGGDGKAGAAADTKLDYKVLLAEDNATNQFALTRILEKLGATVTVAEDGEKAVRAVQQEHFDFVLMDMMMPIMDGLSAARAIRALPEPTCHIPIIALTANAFPEDREATRLAGMNGFATKPTTGARLRAAVLEVMGAPAVAQASVYASGAKDAQSAPSCVEAPIDTQAFDALREELGDEEFREALDIFFDDVHQRLMLMTTGDARAIQSECHALKSSSAMFGMADFATQCAAMEKVARDGGLVEPEGIEKLRRILESAQRQVKLAA